MKRTIRRLAGVAFLLSVVTAAEAGVQSKVWISGSTLKIRDASTGNVLDGDFNNDINVKAKRDEGSSTSSRRREH